MGEKGYSTFDTDNAFLKSIAQHLIMHTSFMHDLSLYHGKMGIILFFAHYARYTGNPLYEAFAGELLDEVCEDIHTGLPVNFEAGICGIGWGIEYLFQHGFMDGDSDEMLLEVDNHVMERDIRRISDLTVQTGLEGLSYYICSRLYSPLRKSKKLPFDKTYLDEWKVKVSSRVFPDMQTIMDSLIKSGPTGEDIPLWPLGLETGCAGIGLKMMEKAASIQTQTVVNLKNEGSSKNIESGSAQRPEFEKGKVNRKPTKHIYIFCHGSQTSGMQYGIGTYTQQLIEFLKNREDVALTIVELHSEEKEVCLYENDGYKTLYCPKIAYLPNALYLPAYYRNVWYILQAYITPEPSEQLIFHLNFNTDYHLIAYLRRSCPACRILYTIHFLTRPVFDFDRPHEASLKNDQYMLSLVDQVICLSSITQKLILKEYHVPKDKIQLIYNGLKDQGKIITKQEKNLLRTKLLFDPDDLILLFVGRIESDKGIQFLMEAFKKIVAIFPQARLIVVGSGEMNQLLSETDGYWSRITVTGYIPKERLLDFYRIADIGVVPSFHEQCSYAVMEMMMHSLPLVTTDGVIGMLDSDNVKYAVPLDKTGNEPSISIDLLVERIINASQADDYRSQIRKNYENRFTLNRMKENYCKLYGIVE